MDEMQFLGYVVTAIITLGGFVAIIMKFIQPINDLRVVIQKLNDSIDAITKTNERQTKRIDKHDDQIENLDHRVGTIETKIDLYHKK